VNDVLAFYCSPRRAGNTDLLLDHFLEGVQESGGRTDRIYVRRLNVQPCIACGGCDDDGHCILSDDMDHLYPKLIETRRLVIAAPIYFYGMPGKSKGLIDRTQALWNRVRIDPGLRRPDGRGFFIGLGGTKGRDLFDGVLLTMKYLFNAIGLPAEFQSLTHRQIDAKGEILNHPAILEESRVAGQKFLQGI
jgi:multimeric flavodoxin WrbA